jgi:hypothetical protein
MAKLQQDQSDKAVTLFTNEVMTVAWKWSDPERMFYWQAGHLYTAGCITLYLNYSIGTETRGVDVGVQVSHNYDTSTYHLVTFGEIDAQLLHEGKTLALDQGTLTTGDLDYRREINLPAEAYSYYKVGFRVYNGGALGGSPGDLTIKALPVGYRY